ncbi:MAG TPA: hypothetical protein VKV57_04235 [bacterium]|nr:hypothetical protein [bacterium]
MDTFSPTDDSHNGGIRATSTPTGQDTDVSMVRAALSDLVVLVAVTRTVCCCLWGANDTLTLQYSEAERHVLLKGYPDPLHAWHCDERYETWRTDEPQL